MRLAVPFIALCDRDTFPSVRKQKTIKPFLSGIINQSVHDQKNRQNPNSLPKKQKPVCCKKKKEKKRCLNEINGWQHVAEPERTECLGKRENCPFSPKQTSTNTHTHTRFYHNSITDHRVSSVHFNLFIQMYCMYRCALQERGCAPRNCGLPTMTESLSLTGTLVLQQRRLENHPQILGCVKREEEKNLENKGQQHFIFYLTSLIPSNSSIKSKDVFVCVLIASGETSL